MDVLSVESCVQAVILAYRDASKLVQRLRNKQDTAEEFILPEDLTKEFEDSLLLGCAAVQSQYDHDVRRFGETYARGDAIAREQMKDILIALQQAVISHLREVFMDEAALNLHALKETSDDCRVNATVCLGQLYQRMSTATAAVKQIHRPHAEEPDKVQLPGSLAYSSSRSTHSSFGGRPFDAQSATSYTTYSSRTATGQDRKISAGLTPQRRISMNSAFSYSSERDRDQPQIRTPGEDNVPALPFPLQRQASQGPPDSASTGTGRFPSNIDLETSSNPASPPPYAPNTFIHTTDDKGQKFPPHSSFYEPPIAEVPENTQRIPSAQPSPGIPVNTIPSRPIQVHELDDSSKAADPQSPTGTPASSPEPPEASPRQTVPLNPEYSTLEYVAGLESRSRPPAALAASAEYQQYMQSLNAQAQLRPQPLFSQGYGNQRQAMAQIAPSYNPAMPSPPYHGQYPPGQQYPGQPLQPGGFVSYQPQPLQSPQFQAQQMHDQSLSRPQTSAEPRPATNAVVDPLLQTRVPPIATASRPLSIRSTGSTGSKIASFALRKALPPGIAEAINKPAPSPAEAEINSQPRYVKPSALNLTRDQSTPIASPTSPIAQQVDNLSLNEKPTTSYSSTAPSLESTMRVASPAMQVSRSELNLPSEANLGGFCKGAVRQQLGSRKKGFAVESKKGVKGQDFSFKCTKCNFEGPATVSAALPSGGRGAVKREKTLDVRVRVSAGGIKYRWAFLAKSHILNKTTHSDANNTNDVFGCYFCCAEGAAKGWFDDNDNVINAQLATLGTFGGNKPTTASHTTPIFNGLAAFMAHLETHRAPARMPGLIAANEMNCIIGRVAKDVEDFDLNLPPLAG